MQAVRKRNPIVLAILSLCIAGLFLQGATPADAAGGQAGLFDQFLSIFAEPARKSATPAPQPVSTPRIGGDSRNPMFPYGGSAKPALRRSPVYRTLCVRTCDGFYWPISNAAPESRFRRDRNVCESSCSQEAKLFYAPQGDSDAGQMMGLDGKPYSALANAFLYRKALQPQCQCKPGPWADSEVLRHKQYAAIERSNARQVALNAPTPAPVVATEDPAPLPDTDGQLGNVAAIAADGAIAANADPLPAKLRPSVDPASVFPAAVKSKRLLKAPKAPAARKAPTPTYSDPLSFSVETVDRGSHRYIPLR
jgi:hypothetical protein